MLEHEHEPGRRRRGGQQHTKHRAIKTCNPLAISRSRRGNRAPQTTVCDSNLFVEPLRQVPQVPSSCPCVPSELWKWFSAFFGTSPVHGGMHESRVQCHSCSLQSFSNQAFAERCTCTNHHERHSPPYGIRACHVSSMLHASCPLIHQGAAACHGLSSISCILVRVQRSIFACLSEETG